MPPIESNGHSSVFNEAIKEMMADMPEGFREKTSFGKGLEESKYVIIAKEFNKNLQNQKLAITYYADCVNYPTSKWWIEWFDREGHVIFLETQKAGFSINGILCVIAHAYKEQATAGRTRGYITHNWWNFGALKGKNPPQKKGPGGWATFPDIVVAVKAYIDRITSPSDLIEYKNPNFNPSFPEVGVLFKKASLPSAEELDKAFRIGTGNYVYCGSGCREYGKEILSLVGKYVDKHFVDFLNFKISCIESKQLTGEDLENAKKEKDYYSQIEAV